MNNTFRISATSTYENIALKSYEERQKAKSEYDKLKDDPKSWVMGKDKDYYLQQYNNCIINSGITCIVFLAMAVESFIYDYASEHLGDTFVKNYIEKLDVKSKWVIIPKLVTGKDLPRDKKGFELLNKLISLRNRFVHSKSTVINLSDITGDKFITKYDSVFGNIDKNIDELIHTLDELKKNILELHS